MSMQRDRLLIAEMITAATRVVELVGNFSAADLDADDLRREAVLWTLTVLGEAATQISEATRSAHPDVPWRPPAQLRNRIVHGYWEVDLDIVVATVRHQIPPLIAQLQAIENASGADD